MYRRRVFGAMIAVVTGGLFAGCQQPAADMQAMQDMKPPERPKEMEMLDKWIGTWTSTSECKMPGSDKPMAGTSRQTVTSVCDGRFIMEQMDADMGDMGKMSAVGIYSWDAKKKMFHSWWFDSFGGVGEGWMCYCPETKTWCMKAEGMNAMIGKPTVGEGTIKMPDDNTMEWKWSESEKTLFGKKKMMDMTGTSKRG